MVMNWGQRFQVEGTARVETESGDLLGMCELEANAEGEGYMVGDEARSREQRGGRAGG